MPQCCSAATLDSPLLAAADRSKRSVKISGNQVENGLLTATGSATAPEDAEHSEQRADGGENFHPSGLRGRISEASAPREGRSAEV
jgi:hypothetical protein